MSDSESTLDNTLQNKPPRSWGDIVIPKKYIFGGMGLVVISVLILTGVASRGYESKTIQFFGVGSASQGTSLGFKQLLLRQGQTLVIDYDLDIERGGLHVHLMNYRDPPGSGNTDLHRITQSGEGQLRIPVEETGLYRLLIRGAPDGTGYHLTYTVYWKTE